MAGGTGLQEGWAASAVIHIDAIFRAVHLIPLGHDYSTSLDRFAMFYVSRFAEHHSFELDSEVL